MGRFFHLFLEGCFMAVIGIMSAMHEELAAVLAALPDEHRECVAGRDFWVGHWQGHQPAR